MHFFHREKRTTLAEIVEQLQEREAAQVWRFMCSVIHSSVESANSHSIYCCRFQLMCDVFKIGQNKLPVPPSLHHFLVCSSLHEAEHVLLFLSHNSLRDIQKVVVSLVTG